jgi:ABC-type proline/glycine betaine transport system ATPase subunit
MTRSDLQAHFRTLPRAESYSTVMVTHDMHEALSMAQYLVVLQSGRVLRAGARDEVLAEPGHDYVRRLLADLNA